MKPRAKKPWWRIRAAFTGEKILGNKVVTSHASFIGLARRLFLRKQKGNYDLAHVRARARGGVRKMVMQLRAKKLPNKAIDQAIRNKFGEETLRNLDPSRDKKE